MRVSVCFAGLLLTACAADAQPQPTPGQTASVSILNKSQYVLLELVVDSDADYMGSANLLEAPLAVDGRVLYYSVGPIYVTVMREKYQGGPKLALTTSTPIYLDVKQGYLLEVLDESFRFTPQGARVEPEQGVPVFGVP